MVSNSPETVQGNQGQIQFWNSGPGKSWSRYQHGLDACFLNINRRLVNICEMKPAGHALDVGCGTGATALALAEKFGTASTITALDVSRPLLEHARKRVIASGCTNIRLLEADVQEHDFSNPLFDLVASRFGVMFFTNPWRAFANLHSAMQVDARLAFASWSTVEKNPWFSIPRNAAVAVLGEGKVSHPRAPGPNAFADIDYVHDILSQSGFCAIQISEENQTIETGLEAALMAELACNLGPAVRLMNEKNGSPADARKIRAMVHKELLSFRTAERFSIPAGIVLVQAKRPA